MAESEGMKYRITLDCNGWRKIYMVSKAIFKSGRLRLPIESLPIIEQDGVTPIDDEFAMKTVVFTRKQTDCWTMD